MPWPLDRNRPFQEIWGLGGVAGYIQDGKEFDALGQPLPGQFPHGKEAKAAAKAARAATPPPLPPLPEPPPPPPEPVYKSPATGYAAMDDETLRGLVEIRGDEWTGREAAIAALEAAG